MFKVNEYFSGKVKSLAYESVDGDATIGVMAAGEYTFATSSDELMRVINGEMQVKLPGSEQWQLFSSGDTFTVAANQSFKVKTEQNVAYLCLYS